jgi:hypothetical protein
MFQMTSPRSLKASKFFMNAQEYLIRELGKNLGNASLVS